METLKKALANLDIADNELQKSLPTTKNVEGLLILDAIRDLANVRKGLERLISAMELDLV